MTVLDRIRNAGVELKVAGVELLARGPMTAEQRKWLAEHKQELVAELAAQYRPVIEYRYADDDNWHVMLGQAGESFESAAAACSGQFGAIETRERETLPAGFPFKRHGDDGEWKNEDGSEL